MSSHAKKTAPNSKASGAKRSTSPKRATSPKRDVSPKRNNHLTPRDTKSKEHASPTSVVTLADMKKAVDDLFHLSNHADDPEFEAAVRICIPGEFILICSQDDHTQAQEDYFAMDHYDLKVPKYVKKVNAGSVATCALLQLMHENPNLLVASKCKPSDEPLNCLQVSREIKARVKKCSKLDAKPTISSSRPLGPKRVDKAPPFYIVPPTYTGTRRALLIGVVNGEGPDLKGTPNDITNIQDFLMKHCGFQRENITVLQDYLPETPSALKTKSTKNNILAEFRKLCRISKPHDVNFIQFSGHGGRTGNTLYILPTDYKTAGQVSDSDILRDLIKAMPKDVYTTMLVDCCYSGTVGDLPYILQHNSHGNQEIDKYYDTDVRKEMLRKEAEGGKEYALYKEARSERRLMGRLTDVMAAVNAAAQSGFNVTSDAAKAGFEATQHGIEYVATSTGVVMKNAADATLGGTKQAASLVTESASKATESTAHVAREGAKRTTSAATAGAKMTTDAAHVAAEKSMEAAHLAAEKSKEAMSAITGGVTSMFGRK